uniref:Uncharacterized protein n=1 Tax=Rhizophora mucronata TaxID=61149 RepID=A0A2P2QA14_RHIMU
MRREEKELFSGFLKPSKTSSRQQWNSSNVLMVVFCLKMGAKFLMST